MKLNLVVIMLLISTVFLSGCGQEMDVTIYNTTGIVYSGPGDATWVQMSADVNNIDGTNKTIFPSDVALTESDCNNMNSFTIQAKENETLNVYAQGWKMVMDATGNTSLEHFESGPENMTLYGSFLSEPHWYAAVYVDNIIIYKKQ